MNHGPTCICTICGSIGKDAWPRPVRRTGPPQRYPPGYPRAQYRDTAGRTVLPEVTVGPGDHAGTEFRGGITYCCTAVVCCHRCKVGAHPCQVPDMHTSDKCSATCNTCTNLRGYYNPSAVPATATLHCEGCGSRSCPCNASAAPAAQHGKRPVGVPAVASPGAAESSKGVKRPRRKMAHYHGKTEHCSVPDPSLLDPDTGEELYYL